MNENEMRKWCEAQTAAWEQWRSEVVATLHSTFEDANRISAQGEERCRAADERTEQRERAWDERNEKTAERAERQVVAWERIAAALERIAAK